MDPSGGGRNDSGLYNQQTAMAGPGMYNQMMIGGYNSNPGSVEGLSVQCDMVNPQVNVLPPMGTFIGQTTYSNCLTMQGQQSPHLARVGMPNFTAYPNMAQNVCLPSNNTLPSFGHCFLTPSFNQQQTQQLFQGNTNQERVSSGFHVISNQMPSIGINVSSAANPMQTSSAPVMNTSAYIPKTTVHDNFCAPFSSSERLLSQHAGVYNVISSMPQKIFLPQHKSQDVVGENVVSSTHESFPSPAAPALPAGDAVIQNKTDVTKNPNDNVNLKQNEETIVHAPSLHTDKQEAEQTSVSKLECKPDQCLSPKVTKEDSASQMIVPFGWRRQKQDGAIVYFSPSNVPLCSTEEVNQYLLSDSTCKCGLECPVIVGKTFNFDVSIESRSWSLELNKSSEDLTNLCNHRRKIVSMATFQKSTFTVTEEIGDCVPKSSKSSDKGKTKKKRSRAGSYGTPYDRVRVADLIAERDRLRSEEETRQASKEPTDKPSMSAVAIQSPIDHVKSPPPSTSNTGLMSPPLPPPLNMVQPLLQTVSDSSRVFPPQFSSMQSTGMLPNTYPPSIADAINIARSNHGVLPTHSPAFFSSDSVHPQQPVNLPPLGSPPLGHQNFGMFPQPGFGLPPGYMEKRGNSSYPMPYTKPSMYRFTNPALSDLIDPVSWSEKKKPKPKKPRVKKDKKKSASVFESDTPPPNVDVSVLKDHGHGPIPKVKCSTPSSQFVENAAGYLADQSAMIKSSLAPGSQDTKENPSTSQVVSYPLPTSSSYGSAGDNLDISTNVVVHTSQPERPDLSISISDTTMRALSMSDNTFTEDRCHSLSPSDSNGECPAETMMPTSIVHHTGKPEIPKVEIKVSDGVKTSDIPSISTIPLQTLSTVNSKQSDGAVLPNFSTIQQLLGYNISNQFPASKMLSAAARAQMAQKTTVVPTELNNVQVTQQLLSSFQKTFQDKSGASVGVVANEQEALKLLAQNATLVSSIASEILPVSQQNCSNSGGLKISTSTTPTFSVDSQIPSVLLQSGASHPQISTTVSNVLTVMNNTQQMSQILNSNNAPLLSTPPTPVVTTQLISQQPTVASSQSAQVTGSQPNLVQTQSSHISASQQTPIIYTQATSILTTQTTPIMHTQATPIINTQATPIMNTQNSQFLSAVGNINQNAVMFSNPALNCAQSNSMFNQVMNPSSLMMPSNLTYTPDQCMPANFNLGGVGNQQIVGNNSNVCIKPLGQFINMDANQIKQALPAQSCDLTQGNLQSGIPNPAGQLLVLPNLQMPLVQVFNNGQKNGAPDINALLSQLHTNLAPMFNAQQVWNNLTTGSNLTAMQLQTLQLQQQLLQQIQQLQGMQTLINQFSAGDMNKLPAQFPMEMDRKDSNALSMVTMVNDVSTTTESPPLQNQENDDESSMEVSSEVTSTDVGNTDGVKVYSTKEEESLNSEDSQGSEEENKRIEDEMDVDAEVTQEKESEEEPATSNCMEVKDGQPESSDTQHSNEEEKTSGVIQSTVKEYEENLSQECFEEDDTRINSSTQTKIESPHSKDCDTSSVSESLSKSKIQAHKKIEKEGESVHVNVENENKVRSHQRGNVEVDEDSACVPDSSQSGENSSKVSCDVAMVTSSTRHSKSTTESTTTVSPAVGLTEDSNMSKGVNGGVTFIEGDLIWGQIRGFPSWPGKVVPPCEVIDPEPLEMGKIWVKWYGDHTFTQVEQDKLKSLVDGLKAHQRQKNRKGRKMNSNLEAAIQEALADLGQITNINSKGKSSKKKRVR